MKTTSRVIAIAQHPSSFPSSRLTTWPLPPPNTHTSFHQHILYFIPFLLLFIHVIFQFSMLTKVRLRTLPLLFGLLPALLLLEDARHVHHVLSMYALATNNVHHAPSNVSLSKLP